MKMNVKDEHPLPGSPVTKFRLKSLNRLAALIFALVVRVRPCVSVAKYFWIILAI